VPLGHVEANAPHASRQTRRVELRLGVVEVLERNSFTRGWSAARELAAALTGALGRQQCSESKQIQNEQSASHS
jgi:hypothetical protein